MIKAGTKFERELSLFVFDLDFELDFAFEFDLDLAIAEDNENPVYYVQYGHARICSILNRPEAQGFEEADGEVDLSFLFTIIGFLGNYCKYPLN